MQHQAWFAEVTQGEKEPHLAALPPDTALFIGRSPTNDVIITDERVSWHHAAIWSERGRVYVRDVGSSNGTLRNGRRIRGAERVEAADQITLGPSTTVRVYQRGTLATARRWMVLDLDSGLITPIRSERFSIGSTQEADLILARTQDHTATLMVNDDGATLTTPTRRTEILGEEAFTVGDHRLRLIERATRRAPTAEPEAEAFPYHLTVTLNGPQGSLAELVNEGTGDRFATTSENQGVLLYMLARRVRRDRGDGLKPPEVGWMTDAEAHTGLWGQRGPSDANGLNVLIHRLRNDLRKRGFNPWLIEKRRRAVRLRLTKLTLH